MDLSRNTRLLLSILAVVIFLLYLLAQSTVSKQTRLKSVTALSASAAGLSAFAEYSRQAHTRLAVGKIDLRRAALLHSSELEGVGLYVAASPVRPFSDREARLLLDFTKAGGSILLSFHNEKSEEIVTKLLSSFPIEPQLEANRNFVNANSTEIFKIEPEEFAQQRLIKSADLPNTGAENPLFSFYSTSVFVNERCRYLGELSCYFQEFPVGKGAVFLFAGLPPIANALLVKNHNWLFAAALVKQFPEIQIDEYRHFFSEKDWRDLLTLPSLALPALALIGGAFIFFAFGYRRRPLTSITATQQVPPLTYHRFHERVLRRLLTRDRVGSTRPLELAVGDIHRLILQQYPKHAVQLKSIAQSDRQSLELTAKQLLRRFSHLVEFHRNRVQGNR